MISRYATLFAFPTRVLLLLLLLPILDDGIFGLRCEDYSWMGVFSIL
jgi:hypothetical protein